MIVEAKAISEIDMLNEKAWSIVRSEPDVCFKLAKELLSSSEKINYHKGKSHALAAMGSSQVWLSNYDDALTALFEARKSLIESNDKQIEAKVVYHIFCCFYFLADYSHAIEYAKQILTLADSTNDEDAKANAYNGIGTIYSTLGENEQAIENFNAGIAIAEKLKDNHLTAKILDGLGTAWVQQGDLKKALECKEKCLQVARNSGNRNAEGFALNSLAKIHFDLKDHLKAETFFKESLQVRREVNFKPGQVENLASLGALSLLLQKQEETLPYLDEALKLAIEIDSKEYLYKIHESFSSYYESKNDVEKFKFHFESFFRNKEIYITEQQRQKVKSNELQLRMVQVEKEKELLEKKHLELENYSRDLELLSSMGKKIASQINIESINKTAYDILRTIMDVAGFGIGVITNQGKNLEFPGYIEEGVIYKNSVYDLADEDRLAAICCNQEIEILIRDFEVDSEKYVKRSTTPIIGKHVQSLIYLPLKSEKNKVGVITVQSFEKNAYGEYHLNILRNLANYCAIAMENATFYHALEEKVKERTEEIEKAYENTHLLSQISKDISSSLSVETIIEKVYHNVNSLMDATGFGIGIYNEEKGKIFMPGYIEKGKKLDDFAYDIDDNRLASWCFKNQKEIFINDYSTEYHKYIKGKQAPVAGKDSSSIIYLPLYLQNKITGVLTVQSFEKNVYTEYHLDILRNLAHSIASALENARLYESMEEKVKERTVEVVKQKEQIEKTFTNTKLISEIGKEIVSLLSVDDIISKLYDSVNSLIDATVFGVAVYKKETHELYFTGVMEKGVKHPAFSSSLNEEKIATICFNEKKEIIINDWNAEYRRFIKEDYDASQGDMPESMLYLPLISKNHVIGVITVQSFEKNAYKDYHVDILRSLSVYVGSAIENANLYENLEEKVEERTTEIAKAYQDTKLLSQISKEISSSLTIETIVYSVYRNVNSLMDAASFGIGVYNSETRMINFPGFIENNERLDFSFHVDDDRLASWCFKNQKEIVTGDYEKDYHKYVKGIKAVVAGNHSRSIIYLPLFNKEAIIGVLTLQSYVENAYSDYHLDILRNLANSISIAIDNASLYSSLEEKVKARTTEVVHQKEIIEEKNKHITDSIIYAKRIQEAILPPEHVFISHLKNSFVLYKPKDIVSGDFYWIEKKGNKILFAVVDCTGHGVPGAFMSIIGYNGLSQIVNEYNITQPAEILNKLNGIISHTLKQRADESKIRDGMDISICCIDIDTNKLQYAGANNPIIIVRNNNVMEIKADKHPIGNFVGEEEFRFTNKEIELVAEDRIYLFSDGYADQFGGPRGKKLKYNQFRDLLLRNHSQLMSKQKKILDFLFEEWRGDLEQIDDVCVIGVQI